MPKPLATLDFTSPLTLLSGGNATPTHDFVTMLRHSRQTLEGPLTSVQQQLQSYLYPWLKNDQEIPLIQFIAAAQYADARLYRAEFRTVEAFAGSIGIRRETFQRRAQKGRVLIHFLESKQKNLPTGKKLAGIAMLPHEHQIPAWNEIHLHIGSRKLTNDVFEYLLVEYRTAHHLWDTPPPSDTGQQLIADEEPTTGANTGAVPTVLMAEIFEALPPRYREAISHAYSRDPAMAFFTTMKRTVKNTTAVQGHLLQAVIKKIERIDSKLATQLSEQAFALLATFLGEMGSRKARDNAREKARYRHRQAKQVKATVAEDLSN